MEKKVAHCCGTHKHCDIIARTKHIYLCICLCLLFQEHVASLLEQYEKYVVRNKIFQEFNRAYADMQHVVQEYKTDGNIDAKESMAVDR